MKALKVRNLKKKLSALAEHWTLAKVVIAHRVDSGPIWTDLVPNKITIFFLKIFSYCQIWASRYKL